MQESTQTQGLTAIDMVIISCEHLGVGFLEVTQQDVTVGNTVVGVAPDRCNGGFYRRVGVVEVVDIAPCSIGIDVIRMRQHLHETDAHVQAIHVLSGHLGIDTRQLVLKSSLTTKVLFLLDLRFGIDVEPVVARGKDERSHQQNTRKHHLYHLIIYITCSHNY